MGTRSECLRESQEATALTKSEIIMSFVICIVILMFGTVLATIIHINGLEPPDIAVSITFDVDGKVVEHNFMVAPRDYLEFYVQIDGDSIDVFQITR